MNAAGIKNVILMTLLILILHFMIKNFFLERQTTNNNKGGGGVPRDNVGECKIACATETACLVACKKSSVPGGEATPSQEESHHDALKKFVFDGEEDDSSMLPPPPPPPPTHSSISPPATNRVGAFEWISDDNSASISTDDASSSGGLSGFCADSDRCGFSFL